MTETLTKIELPGYIIERTAKKMKQSFARMLTANHADITVDQWVVLQLLEKETGLNQLDIATKSFKDAPTITRMLDLLEQKSLLNRLPDPSDRRKFVIEISNKGKQLIKRLKPAVKQFRETSYENIDPLEMEKLFQTMNTIFENLENM
jgi:DNA-binding MarR family transcriptional regulator